MRILVTGGAGFFGGYTIVALERAGHECHAYDIAPPSPEIVSVAPSLAARLVIGEIGDYQRLLSTCRDLKIDAIVHAAGLVGYERSLENPRAFYETNVMGFVNVCEAARELDLKKVVLISSNAVYHKGSGDKLAETDLPFSTSRSIPAAHYGTSKMACEAIGLVYAEFHGLDFLALRVTAIYGFGMRNPVHIKPMVENAVLGKPTRFETGGPMKRDYTHVLDCASAVVAAVERPPQQIGAERIINVAAGKVTTCAELAEIVREVVPGADIFVGDTLTPMEAENLKMRAPMDITLARRELGWAPRWSIEEGIRQYAEQFRNYANPRY
ncbi:NAD-dependent epimerase/dehydratase family protein [Sinorhizobium meliloti]|uniref:NAD-dependent epimerase/dehydratase family protein n=1 Tax=Rhizobium meliloti TaxID=382 RepID=UPI0012967383|nr:NAD(P)-dependent oxidoreductase [Sinorhizobium meliloti]MDW9610868.1 NAD-dependent epimerase/dehydratase family protein [Sinorhizobium meliloti]MDW9835940.1 NAD-dependent epimerase/dehydratase family protein [Sinorhizobium meliloti]MDX0040371.1 NAD-dependent epimerase/dehydratase family protein [Sinorhizobium meliloti]MDX0088893.1 NAD-dependent epimerase/dehydratase family protein [Sinorhizobium meliloti]MQX63433.1 NAD-dependent epimerase/dehydratase family protein [Sinorhizobium meliloti]